MLGCFFTVGSTAASVVGSIDASAGSAAAGSVAAAAAVSAAVVTAAAAVVTAAASVVTVAALIMRNKDFGLEKEGEGLIGFVQRNFVASKHQISPEERRETERRRTPTGE